MPIPLHDSFWIEDNDMELSGVYILIDSKDMNRLPKLRYDNTYREGYVIVIRSSYSHCREANWSLRTFRAVIIIMIDVGEKRSGSQKVNVLPDPVGEILIIFFC